jgi:phosphoribosylformylglycinamidine cyclo-ligase
MNENEPGEGPYTYAQAGVSIAAGNALVRAIGPLARSTRRPGADADLGGFGGIFDLKAAGFTDPLLVAANGETAEMPGMYADGDYDLAGFCVGAVERSQLLDGSAIRPGDVILGLASTGVHSNGFSLVRRLAADKGWKLDRPAVFDQDVILIDALMAPTRIYVKSLLPQVRKGAIHGLAHITGGGLLENVPRVLPKDCHARIDSSAWPLPRLMAFLQAQGNIEPEEMARTFNCGVGMVAVVAAGDADIVAAELTAAGETVHRIGTIEAGERGCTVFGAAETWSARSAWSATHNG